MFGRGRAKIIRKAGKGVKTMARGGAILLAALACVAASVPPAQAGFVNPDQALRRFHDDPQPPRSRALEPTRQESYDALPSQIFLREMFDRAEAGEFSHDEGMRRWHELQGYERQGYRESPPRLKDRDVAPLVPDLHPRFQRNWGPY